MSEIKKYVNDIFRKIEYYVLLYRFGLRILVIMLILSFYGVPIPILKEKGGILIGGLIILILVYFCIMRIKRLFEVLKNNIIEIFDGNYYDDIFDANLNLDCYVLNNKPIIDPFIEICSKREGVTHFIEVYDTSNNKKLGEVYELYPEDKVKLPINDDILFSGKLKINIVSKE